jgi:hypothetical protein
MAKLHAQHVLEHLQRVQDGHTADTNPEAVFLGRDEGDAFWELVGLRMTGCPVVLLAALRFQRHDLPGVPFGRESLASYLSGPPYRSSNEPGTLAAVLPSAMQTIPFFLRGLQVGRSVTTVNLDPSRVEVAFDFRSHSPSALAALKAKAPPLREYYLRSVAGHVLRGYSHELSARHAEENQFIAVRSPVQVTPSGSQELPSLIVNRRFVTLTADVTEEATRVAAGNWVPFLTAAAARQSILPLPRVGSA